MKRNQQVSISKGNRKLGGVMNISTTPRRCCPEGVPCASGGCYAWKAYRLYPATRKAWSRNERIARDHPDSYFARSRHTLPRPGRVYFGGMSPATSSAPTTCTVCAGSPMRIHIRISWRSQSFRDRQPI